jgi:hypothetical protein
LQIPTQNDKDAELPPPSSSSPSGGGGADGAPDEAVDDADRVEAKRILERIEREEEEDKGRDSPI